MRGSTSHNSRRGDGAGIAAVLAVFALLVQALLPSAAMAAQTAGGAGEAIVICTQMGVQVVKPDQQPASNKGFAGLPCQHCLAAAHAVTLTPEVVVEPIAYVVTHLRRTPAQRREPSLARAPPRPPGQGPPTLNT